MIEPVLARCDRTSGIAAALLDGLDPPPVDRAHIAACVACHLESERALRFTRGLATAAVEVSDGIPDPVVVGDHRMEGVRIGRFMLRVASVATLGGAIAVGLVLAAIIGSRAQPPASQPPDAAFVSVAMATEALSPLGLTCGSVGADPVCRSTAPDHSHRVTLTMADGRVVEVEARIESTDGTSLDLSGVDDFLSRIAAAVLMPEVGTPTATWIRDAYPTCGAGCSGELEEISFAMAKDGRSVSLSLRER